MKTIHNLRKFQRVMMIGAILAFLNIGVAQNYYLSAGTLITPLSVLKNGNDIEKSMLSTNYSIEKPVLDEMDQNPDYWMDYLNTTVKGESEESSATESSSSGILNQMDADPLYWINYLKANVDDETNANESILNTMENDPYYWPHYLQNTVNTDAI